MAPPPASLRAAETPGGEGEGGKGRVQAKGRRHPDDPFCRAEDDDEEEEVGERFAASRC